MTEAPVTAEESPAAKVKCYGAGLQPSAVHKGQKAMFTVDATQATVTNAPVNVTTTNLQTGRPIVMNIHRLSSHSSNEYVYSAWLYFFDKTYFLEPIPV